MQQKSDADHAKTLLMQLVRAVQISCTPYRSWLAVRRLCLAVLPWFAITGCVAAEVGLDGTWQLATIDSSPIEISSENEIPFFTITGNSIEGFDGCNRFNGPIDRPGAISSTRRACPDLKYRLPLDLNELDAHLQGAQVDGDAMIVPAHGDFPMSTYVRKSK